MTEVRVRPMSDAKSLWNGQSSQLHLCRPISSERRSLPLKNVLSPLCRLWFPARNLHKHFLTHREESNRRPMSPLKLYLLLVVVHMSQPPGVLKTRSSQPDPAPPDSLQPLKPPDLLDLPPPPLLMTAGEALCSSAIRHKINISFSFVVSWYLSFLTLEMRCKWTDNRNST